MLSDAQVERYSRQIVLPEIGGRGQERLLASSVSIRGAGKAADACVGYLAAAGVGRASVEPMVSPDVEIWISSHFDDRRSSAKAALLWGSATDSEVVVARFRPGEVCDACLRALSSGRTDPEDASLLLGTLLAAEALRALIGFASPRTAEVVRLDLRDTTISTEPLPHQLHEPSFEGESTR